MHEALCPMFRPDLCALVLRHDCIRYFLAGDDMKCEAVEGEIMANYRRKEEAILAQQAKSNEVREQGRRML